nr:MAG TPA: hypothetical protein [Caudoviricetes sp.]DAQ83855.1 MAG TPA: hypothetical protein [Caudoviricetes sp.]
MSEKQKTITVLISEFKTSIFNAVNDSGLPAAVIEPILGSLYQQVAAIAAAQLEQEKANEQEGKKE